MLPLFKATKLKAFKAVLQSNNEQNSESIKDLQKAREYGNPARFNMRIIKTLELEQKIFAGFWPPPTYLKSEIRAPSGPPGPIRNGPPRPLSTVGKNNQ